MYDVITVPLDRSPTAERALPVADALVRRLGARLDLVTLVLRGADPAPVHRYHEDRRRALGLADGDSQVLEGFAGRVLGELAEDVGRLICLTSHAKSPTEEMVLGSVTAEVIRTSPHPVLVVGPAADVENVGFETVVACVDGFEPSELVIETAAAWATALGLTMWLFEVVGDQAVLEPDVIESSYVEGTANRWTERLGAEVEWEVGHGPPANSIVDFTADLPAPLLAMGTRARPPRGQLTVGSVASRVVHGAPCPVLLRRSW